MKKNIVMLLLSIVVCVTGCAGKEEEKVQVSVVTEEETTAEEYTEQETGNAEQNETSSYDKSKVDDYMVSVEEQSDRIKNFLEYEAMTQLDMNEKSQELYEIWDGALNYLWGELKTILSDAEFETLLEEQRTWISEKEAAVAEAGKEVEGGSMYALVVNSRAAELTEARVYELYEMFQ